MPHKPDQACKPHRYDYRQSTRSSDGESLSWPSGGRLPFPQGGTVRYQGQGIPLDAIQVLSIGHRAPQCPTQLPAGVEPDHLMECAIYNELVARGLNVDVGMIDVVSGTGSGKRERKQLKIDFIVNDGRKKRYIQSAYKLPDGEKREQETRGLKRIPDSFGKLVIVDGIQPFYTDESGISYVSLMDFLMKPEIIE